MIHSNNTYPFKVATEKKISVKQNGSIGWNNSSAFFQHMNRLCLFKICQSKWYNRERGKMVHIKTVLVENKVSPRCGQPEAAAMPKKRVAIHSCRRCNAIKVGRDFVVAYCIQAATRFTME